MSSRSQVLSPAPAATRAAYKFTVLLEPADEGGYVVTCPALPGVVTQGDTLDEALEMSEDAVLAYLESLRDDNMPIPEEKKNSQKASKNKICREIMVSLDT